MTELPNTGPLPAEPFDEAPSREAELAELDWIAHQLDTQFSLLGFRFGWDGILGLIPGIGDVATFLPSAWLVYRGYLMGARKRVLARMAVNTGLDFIVGGIPVIGDLFDVVYKANRRNIGLLKAEIRRDAVQKPRTGRSST